MINEYIIYKDSEYIDYHIMQYYKCKIVKPFGPFKRGNVVQTVFVDYEKGTLIAYDKEWKELFRSKLKLSMETKNEK